MSTYIRVERYATESKILQIRTLHAVLGEDANGLLTQNNPNRSLLSLFTTKTSPIIRVEADNYCYNSVTVEKGFQTAFNCGDRLAGDDYTFIFFPSLDKAETLAYTNASLSYISNIGATSIDNLYLSIKLATLEKRAHLYRGITLTVGSSDNSTVQLDIKNIKSKHFSMRNTDKGIVVTPLDGNISYRGKMITGSIILQKNDKIILEPTGLICSFHI